MSQAIMFSELMRQGVALVRRALSATLVTQWQEIADKQYARIESIEQREGIDGVRRWLPPGQHYLPNVSSVSLQGVYADAEWQRILEAVADASLRALIEQELGGPGVCDLDRAWVRRQYAIHRRPPGHASHSWHQDGALLYPFDPTGEQPPATDGLLRMVTCWLPLTPCGRQAPGLEFVLGCLESLQPPARLTDDRLRARHHVKQFWAPELEPGDAVIFGGGTLHRTRVEPAMQSDRISIELRFFQADAIPERLSADRFVALPRGNGRLSRSG
jgi:hypothetical protein